MKICTDTLLFGAMMPVSAGQKVLDIGTGSGVLALMAAQLGGERITGVELTQEAFREAKLNFSLSPWTGRLRAVHQSIQDFTLATDFQYDLIVSNPPFFERHSPSNNALRRTARHTEHLPFAELIGIIGELLKPQGYFYLLLPVHAIVKFSELAQRAGLYAIRETLIRGFAHTEARVGALTFCRSRSEYVKEKVTVYESVGVYTEESERYLSAFLLRFAESGRKALK